MFHAVTRDPRPLCQRVRLPRAPGPRPSPRAPPARRAPAPHLMKGARSGAAGGDEGAPSEPVGDAVAQDDGAPRAQGAPAQREGSAPPAQPGGAKRKRAAPRSTKEDETSDVDDDERAATPSASTGGGSGGGGDEAKELPAPVVEEGRLYLLYRQVPP